MTPFQAKVVVRLSIISHDWLELGIKLVSG